MEALGAHSSCQMGPPGILYLAFLFSLPPPLVPAFSGKDLVMVSCPDNAFLSSAGLPAAASLLPASR